MVILAIFDVYANHSTLSNCSFNIIPFNIKPFNTQH